MPPSVLSPQQFIVHDFDYLIVGGGTAGLVIATRLSEDLRIKVGVLEAGPAAFDTPEIDVPGRYGETLGGRFDWQFETTPQPALGGRIVPWPRGKVLGGTSALNFMTWNRPSREDLDAWEGLGNKGWGWDAMMPFYKKSEHFYGSDSVHQEKHKSYVDQTSHGTDGPISITYTNEHSVSHQYWHDTLRTLGVQVNKKHLAGSNVGVWTNVVNVHPESVARAYSANSYYLPHAERENLMVLTDAVTREIVLERIDNEWVARGVRFVCGDEEFIVTASKETILSAGSICSPQLLELSGIGNPSVLKAAGVTVKVENENVGENLQDHIMAATIYEVDPSIPSPDDLKTDPSAAAMADQLYSTTRTGPLTILPCSICYLPLSHFVPSEKLADLCSRAKLTRPTSSFSQRKLDILTRRFTHNQQLGQIEYIFDIGNWSPFFISQKGKKYGTMLQILQYPFSVGSIHIPPQKVDHVPTTSDSKPIIDPKYYLGPNGQIDFDVLKVCVAYGDEIARTAPLSRIIKQRASPPLADDDWGTWLTNNTITDWHPVGTCSMGGSEGITGGVVDERLRVYGVRGLRVVDASIMPLQISAHLQATVYAIAEKGATMILEDGGYEDASYQK